MRAPKRSTRHALGAFIAMVTMAAAAIAASPTEEPRPIVYSYFDYPAQALTADGQRVAYDPTFIPLISIFANGVPRPCPETVADYVVDTILWRLYPTFGAQTLRDAEGVPRVGIFLNGFGAAPKLEDDVSCPTDPGCTIRFHPTDAVVPQPWPANPYLNDILRTPSGNFPISPEHPCNGHVSPFYSIWPYDCEAHELTNSPWTSHGVATTRRWMQKFIARYKERQMQNAGTDKEVPDPTMFTFDYEPPTFGIGFANYDDPIMWKWITLDPRWHTEGIPGYAARGGKRNMTLSEIYDAERVYWGLPPQPIDLDTIYDERNWLHQLPGSGNEQSTRFFLWAHRVMEQANEGAFKEAAYDPIHDPINGWGPGVATRNWKGHAGGTDGALAMVDFEGRPSFRGAMDYAYGKTIPPWEYYAANGQPVTPANPPIASFNTLSYQILANQFSPNLNIVPDAPGWRLPGESRWAASLRYHRYILEAIATSSHPAGVRDMAPEVQIAGHSFQGGPALSTRADQADELALCRAKQSKNLVLFVEDPDAVVGEKWLDEMGAYADAYSVRVKSYAIVTGTQDFMPAFGENKAARLWYSGGTPARNAIVIRPAVVGKERESTIEVVLIGVPSSPTQGVKFNIEVGASACAGPTLDQISVAIKLANGPWTEHSLISPENPPRRSYASESKNNVVALYKLPIGTNGLVDNNGEMRLRITHTVSMSLCPVASQTSFDLVQGVLFK